MKKHNSIFSAMEKEGLTTLEIFQNRKEDRFILRGMREWDDDIRWDRYMTDFAYVEILTDSHKGVGTATLLTAFDELGLKDYLKQIEQLMREGKHHGIKFYYNRKKNIRAMHCKHITALGIRNRRHAIWGGAMRRHELDEPEIDVITDGLNIARAMTYKNAIANIPYGGSKILVQCEPVKLDDFETMGFLAYVSDTSRSFTGPDMNFEVEMAYIIRDKFTVNYTDGLKTSMGTSGAVTAYGEYIAIKEACDFVYGSRDISNKKIAVQGLGEVGFPLAEHLLGEGAKLIITDINLSKVHRLQQKWGVELVEYVEPDAIYTVDADIFSPCAMGGIITEDRIRQFNFKIIMGSANNQLKATSKEAEIELAKKLADAGILFVVDWAHNVGGVLKAWAEWVFQEKATLDKIKPRVQQICGTNLRQFLEEAERIGKTPTALIYEKIEDLICSGTEFSEEL